MKKKKKGIICLTVITIFSLLTAAGLYIYKNLYTPSADGEAYTTAVSSLSGQVLGQINRYAGVVEPQETIKIQKNNERTLGEIFVHEGDTVHVGDPLFSYDSDEAKMALEEVQLELERIDVDIATLKEQISTLETEKKSAPESEIFYYTSEIQTAQNNVKHAEFDKKSKEAHIEKLKKATENTTVVSEIDGVIKQINADDEAFITILADGGYRIKGRINEQNLADISIGLPVLIYSRTDEGRHWNGTITDVDTLSPASEVPGSGLSPENSILTSSNYHFYVEPAEYISLFLGQHVFMESNIGQTDVREGIWLSSYYLIHDDTGTYVWAADENQLLEKRPVRTGEYDSLLDEYEILDGLSPNDTIAFPEEFLREGMPCIQDDVQHKNITITEAIRE